MMFIPVLACLLNEKLKKKLWVELHVTINRKVNALIWQFEVMCSTKYSLVYLLTITFFAIFVFTLAFLSTLLPDGMHQSHEKEKLGLDNWSWCVSYYTLDALPVAQPAVSKH